MSVRLANRSFQYLIGLAKNMLVKVGQVTFPMDFVILEIEEDSKFPLIIGRPFLHTADAKKISILVGIKRLLDDLRVTNTATNVGYLDAKQNLVAVIILIKNILSISTRNFTSSLMLLVKKLLLLVLKVNATGMKVTTAERLQLLEEFMLTEKRSKTYKRKYKDFLKIKIT
ncbi:reverse transcriptase domain-containing protein [Tanacetum coccineum]|uniref:Reverse transcriptase domain-containing protein n=1 Tax=Tanacetum coccineum TaxID=301880 RepID=A0ABQ5FRH3_9ASTR